MSRTLSNGITGAEKYYFQNSEFTVLTTEKSSYLLCLFKLWSLWAWTVLWINNINPQNTKKANPFYSNCHCWTDKPSEVCLPYRRWAKYPKTQQRPNKAEEKQAAISVISVNKAAAETHLCLTDHQHTQHEVTFMEMRKKSVCVCVCDCSRLLYISVHHLHHLHHYPTAEKNSRWCCSFGC